MIGIEPSTCTVDAQAKSRRETFPTMKRLWNSLMQAKELCELGQCAGMSECRVSLSYLQIHCCTNIAPRPYESDDEAEKPKNIHVDGITLRFE